MSAWESVKIAIVRRKLLTNRVSPDSESPLEEWMRLKAQATCKSNKELKKKIGSHDLENMTRADFEEYQLFRFREQMKYVEENTTFYRDHFKKAGVRPEDIQTYDDLQKVPFTLPSDLAAEPMYFMAVSRSKTAREFSTTGTTGTRKLIGYTLNDLVSKIDIVAAALKGIGMTNGDSLHIMFPAVSAWDPSLMLAGACKIAGYGSSTCSSPDINEQMRVIKESKSTFVIGLPSFIYRVTAIMGENVDLKTLGIKKVISTSEPLSESMRSTLQDAWGCKVLDVWGMTEFGLACAVECDEQNNLHTDEASLLFEVIDPETGKHVKNGEVGELVVSSLVAEATPILRYRTRDLSALFDPPCNCGSKFNRRIKKPAGRMDLQFKIGMGYKIYPVLFDEALFKDPAVVDYQVKITKEGFRDILTFEVESADKSDALAKSIIDTVSKIMEINDGITEDLVGLPRVEFRDVGTMEYSAKAKKIVDLR